MQTIHICNLLATLSKPLNWNLYITTDGEERVPFHLYITDEDAPPCTSSQAALLSHFSQLPMELQLRVLDFCSAPTLYQMMHTSMLLRVEAAKRFWSEPDAYYLVEAHWLFGGGHPGYTYYDLSFMAYVQNVEIEDNDKSIVDLNFDGVGGIELYYDKAREFWRTFRMRFPHAKRVVVNSNREKRYESYQNDEPIAYALKILVETCPVDLEISVFVLVEISSSSGRRTVLPDAKNWHRVLYRLTDDGKWRKLTASKFERKTVLMPHRRFNGLVGKFNRLLHEEETNQLQLTGLGAVAIEAFDRQYFGKENPEPFRCPTGQCEVYLEKAGQWTQHACKRHGADLYMKQPEILPSTLPHVFEERKNSLIKGRGARLREFRKIHNDWNEEGGKKRQELERGWIHQLDNDETWNTGVKGEDSKLWENFIWLMGFPTSCIDTN